MTLACCFPVCVSIFLVDWAYRSFFEYRFYYVVQISNFGGPVSEPVALLISKFLYKVLIPDTCCIC